VLTDTNSGVVSLCQPCLVDFMIWLADAPAIMLAPEWELDVDEAEHHPTCLCPDCDPDFQMELHRDERMLA
jgi:hypothetical protein